MGGLADGIGNLLHPKNAAKALAVCSALGGCAHMDPAAPTAQLLETPPEAHQQLAPAKNPLDAVAKWTAGAVTGPVLDRMELAAAAAYAGSVVAERNGKSEKAEKLMGRAHELADIVQCTKENLGAAGAKGAKVGEAAVDIYGVTNGSPWAIARVLSPKGADTVGGIVNSFHPTCLKP